MKWLRYGDCGDIRIDSIIAVEKGIRSSRFSDKPVFFEISFILVNGTEVGWQFETEEERDAAYQFVEDKIF